MRLIKFIICYVLLTSTVSACTIIQWSEQKRECYVPMPTYFSVSRHDTSTPPLMTTLNVLHPLPSLAQFYPNLFYTPIIFIVPDHIPSDGDYKPPHKPPSIKTPEGSTLANCMVGLIAAGFFIGCYRFRNGR